MMSIQEKLKQELHINFELNVSKTHVVLRETIDYYYETCLTPADVDELIEILTKLRSQMR